MLNKIFKSCFIVVFCLFAISWGSCKKPEDTKAIITVVDVDGDVVEGAKVRLHQDGQISQSGQYSIVSDEQWTDSNGQTEHILEYEAILQVDVSKWVGNNELTGSNVINFKKNKTVTQTIEID